MGSKSFPFPLLLTLLTLYFYIIQAGLLPQVHFRSILPTGSAAVIVNVNTDGPVVMSLSPGEERGLNVPYIHAICFAIAFYGQNNASFIAHSFRDAEKSVYWRAISGGFEMSYDKSNWTMKAPWHSK